MTKFVLLASLLMLSFNTFADCGCGIPTFTEQDEASAVEKFVTTKLSASMVRAMTLTETIPYTTYIPSMDPSRGGPIFRSGGLGLPPGSYLPGTIDVRTGPTKCEAECSNKENSVRKFDVEFVKADKVCVVNLKVTMTSRGETFNTLVKQKYAPVCR